MKRLFLWVLKLYLLRKNKIIQVIWFIKVFKRFEVIYYMPIIYLWTYDLIWTTPKGRGLKDSDWPSICTIFAIWYPMEDIESISSAPWIIARLHFHLTRQNHIIRCSGCSGELAKPRVITAWVRAASLPNALEAK